MAYARPRKGRGGGVEYNIALFPALARIEYERRHRKVLQIAPVPAPAPEPALGGALTNRSRDERDARLAIVRAYEAFARDCRLTVQSKTHLFVADYNLRRLQIDEWVRERIPSISKRSLFRWRGAKASQLGHDPSKSRLGTGLIDVAFEGRLKGFILGAIATQPHLPAEELRDQIRYEFGDAIADRRGDMKPVPPVRTLQHYVKHLREREAVVLAQWTNPDHYRSHMAPSGVGSHRWVVRPNQLWMIDASPIDALCVDGRHSIYACIDIATRRTLLYVSRTPRAAAVAMLIRLAILAWGAPREIKTDNGSDFVARGTKRLFDSLDIRQTLSDPYTPQQKGHVERVIKTFQHKFVVLLPGYVGHSVADRKTIEERKSFADRLGQPDDKTFGVSLTGAELQSFANDWINLKYQHRPHAGLRKSPLGRTPFLAGAAATDEVRRVDIRALDVLMMPVAGGDGVRTAAKTGLRIDGFHYVCLQALPGDRLFMRMDPADAGRAYAFKVEDGTFVGEALCAELAGLDPAELTRAHKAAQSAHLADRARDAKAEARKIKKGPHLIERALEVAVRDLPDVIPFPKREIEHTTPAIEAALDVTREAEVVPLDPRAAEIHSQLKAELDGPAFPAIARLFEETAQRRAEIATRSHVVGGNVAALPESPKERFRRAKMVEAAIAGGEQVDQRDCVWLGQYQGDAEYSAHQQMLDVYGETYLAF
ncbi:DDE-type integrase/transposase/recombinase [Methylopila sp. M107]|uniref:DDE-type integrase/transposase/recombinase n=1 Tax=Methylopila sp. M107 TaxID=1101190 RepID=UPI00035DA8A0|nr:DDE-type integrase/transposase/recombinase [Methylopila sp. M107]